MRRGSRKMPRASWGCQVNCAGSRLPVSLAEIVPVQQAVRLLPTWAALVSALLPRCPSAYRRQRRSSRAAGRVGGLLYERVLVSSVIGVSRSRVGPRTQTLIGKWPVTAVRLLPLDGANGKRARLRPCSCLLHHVLGHDLGGSWGGQK